MTAIFKQTSGGGPLIQALGQMSALSNLCMVVIAYVLAWIFSFVLVAGFDFSLVPSYFVWGWSFSGGELPSSVWLLSLPILLAMLLAWTSAQWARRRQRT